MKFGSKFFAVFAFGTAVLLCAAAHAGVCFITGDCGSSSVIASRLCSADYGGQYTSCSETGFKLGGKSCFYNGMEKYERCECSTSYFKYDDFTDGDKYVYYDWANKSSDNARYCEEKRAHAKKCKSDYQFAASTDISKSWTNSHYAVSACPTNKELDVTAGTCTEIENLKEGGSPYTRYKSCRCKSGIDWKNCDKPHQVATSSAITCDDLVSECTCESGYEIADDGTCEEIKPDIPDGSEKCGRRGARYVNEELVGKNTCEVKEDYNWELYYPENKRLSEINGLACKFMELNPSTGVKVFGIAQDENIENAINHIVDEMVVYEVHMHPLFSSRIDQGDGWGFDLGIADQPLAYKGKGYDGEFNFPFLLYGVLHDAGSYEMYCSAGEDEDIDNPKEYAYYGWLGNITNTKGWTADNPIVTGDPEESDPYEIKPFISDGGTLAVLYRPYGGKGKSCHPSNFNPYREYECSEGDCSILAKSDDDPVWGFGGDKCFNHVFNLDVDELTMPLLIVNIKEKIAYRINSEPRFGVGYGSDFEWTPTAVLQDKEENVKYFDYAGNFLTWRCSDNTCQMTCNDTKKEYRVVEGCDINTYPYMNGYWITSVMNGGVDVDHGLEHLSHEKEKSTNHNIVHTFIGGDDYVEAEYGYSGETQDWLWRKYFYNNMGNTINGVFPISNPADPFIRKGCSGRVYE